MLRYRFDKEIVYRLLKVDFDKLTNSMVKEHLKELYSDEINLDQLEWLPIKGEI